MTAMEGVRKIMKLREITPAVLRGRLGIEKSNVLSQRFTQKNVSVGVLNEMVRAMGYKVVLVPVEEQVSKNSIEINGGEHPMFVRDIIATRMKERGFTNQSLAEKLGHKYASNVSERLRNKNGMRVDVLVKMLEALDCELVVRSTTLPKKEWIITTEDA